MGVLVREESRRGICQEAACEFPENADRAMPLRSREGGVLNLNPRWVGEELCLPDREHFCSLFGKLCVCVCVVVI